MSYFTGFRCVHCGREYNPADVEYYCPACGYHDGILDAVYNYESMHKVLNHASLAANTDLSMWRYLPLLPVQYESFIPDLHVGWTPLYDAPRLAAELGVALCWVKDEGRNPTASFKDRASAIGVVKALEQHAERITCASTGNAASSLAGFAAAAGIPATIFVPARAPEAKVAQLLVYGAQVFCVQGTSDEAWELCMQASAEFGWYNRNCAINPYLIEGKKTVTLELVEQCATVTPGSYPDWVPVPPNSNVYYGSHQGASMQRFLASLGLIAISFVPSLFSQDTRTVTEPVIPPFCASLDAHLTSVDDGTYNTLAPADESKLDTERIQKAIDSCGKGKAVALQAHGTSNAFLSGPLELREGVTLVVDKGTTLFETLDPAVMETAPGGCGIVATGGGGGCKPLISVTNVSGAGIMGDGVIDGRGGEKLLGKDENAWELGQRANVNGGAQRVSRLIVCNHADNFTLYRITLRNSPNFHVSYRAGDGFTVWGVKIDTVRRDTSSPHPLSRNTDGIDPSSGSKNITITHCYFREGDDNIAIKGGGPGELTQMTVSHNHFYWGHGMSIGSETNGGVSKLRVFDLSLDGTDSGIRIKSMGTRGGLVHDAVYEDICIRNSGRPIDITMAYDANGPAKGPSPPTFKDITLKNVRISGGGKILFDGYDHDHRAQITLDGVWLTDAAHPDKPYTYTFDYADITYGAGGSNIQLPTPATDVTITGKPSAGKTDACADKFVPFPQ